MFKHVLGHRAGLKRCDHHRMPHRSMPSDEHSDPKMRVHAAAKRGHAAMLVQRNTKNCEVTASKQCLLVEDEFENWMKEQFQAGASS